MKHAYVQHASRAASRNALLTKAVAVLLALALSVSMATGFAAPHALAAGSASQTGQTSAANLLSEDESAGSATLTIVYGINWDGSANAVVNKTYDFAEGDTLEDLFAAAVEAGDIQDYTFSWGYLSSLTLADGTVVANASDYATYWSVYKNCTYASGSEATSYETLVDGVTYQFAWESYPTAVAPSDWSSVVAEATASSQVAGTGDEVGTATLSIVYGINWDGSANAVVNKTYAFAEGATLEDLFAAAAEAGDIQDYTFSWGYLNSLTLASGTVVANASDYATYWSVYKNCTYASGSEATSYETLVDGVTYQFAWESYPTATAPSDWSAIVVTSPSDDEEENPNTDYVATEIDTEAYTNLFDNISASYAGTSEYWQALELAAIGQASSVDVDAIVAAATEAMDDPDTTVLQKAVIVLTALGVDATTVTGSDGMNLIEKMATTSVAQSTINGKIFMLLAYECGSYDVPSSALKSKDTLLSEVLAAQLSDGGFAYSGSYADADMTAMVIAALAPYRSDATVEAAIESALSALRNLQCEDGGFPASTTSGYEESSNANSTAMVIVALAALGIDAGDASSLSSSSSTSGVSTLSIDTSSSWAVESGATPLSALLSLANSSETGFTYGGTTNALATEQGFRALVAYQGYLNAGGAYNIYLQAADGSAGTSSNTTDNKADDDADDDATESTDTTNSSLAETGDSLPVAGMGISALALCALVTLAAASRKRAQLSGVHTRTRA